MAHHVQKLSRDMTNAAISCFARAIARHWPNTESEASSWVQNEFLHPDAVLLGVIKSNQVIGVCCVTPMKTIRLTDDERTLLQKEVSLPLHNCLHFGGLGVEESFEEEGIGTLLHNEVMKRFKGKILLGHTGRPSSTYPLLRSLTWLKKIGAREIFPEGTFWYQNPNDLEKIWIWWQP